MYIKLLDLLLLLCSFMSILSDEWILRFGGRLTSPAKVKPAGWRSKEDSLAVLMVIFGDAGEWKEGADANGIAECRLPIVDDDRAVLVAMSLRCVRLR